MPVGLVFGWSVIALTIVVWVIVGIFCGCIIGTFVVNPLRNRLYACGMNDGHIGDMVLVSSAGSSLGILLFFYWLYTR